MDQPTIHNGRFRYPSNFIKKPDEAQPRLAHSDDLVAESEERVFEITLRWMRSTPPQTDETPAEAGPPGALRGCGLLRHVRLPLLGADALDVARRNLAVAPEEVQALVHEAYLISLIAPFSYFQTDDV